MPGFDPIALRPEEQNSGFSPGDLSDLFELERLPIYPGKEAELAAQQAAQQAAQVVNAEAISLETALAPDDMSVVSESSADADAMMAMQMAASMARFQEDDDLTDYQPPADIFGTPTESAENVFEPEPFLEPLPEPDFAMMNQPLQQAFSAPAPEVQPFVPPTLSRDEQVIAEAFPSFAEPLPVPVVSAPTPVAPAPAPTPVVPPPVAFTAPAEAMPAQAMPAMQSAPASMEMDPSVLALMQSELNRSEKRKQKKAEDRSKELEKEPIVPPAITQGEERFVDVTADIKDQPPLVHREGVQSGIGAMFAKLRSRFGKKKAMPVGGSAQARTNEAIFTRKRMMVLGIPLLLFTVLGAGAYVWFGMLHKPLPFFAKSSADSTKAHGKKDDHAQAHTGDSTHTEHSPVHHDTVANHQEPVLSDNVGTHSTEHAENNHDEHTATPTEHTNDVHAKGTHTAQQAAHGESERKPQREKEVLHPSDNRSTKEQARGSHSSSDKSKAGKAKTSTAKKNIAAKKDNDRRSGKAMAQTSKKSSSHDAQQHKTSREANTAIAQPSKTGLFSVQVYASPSSEDAEQWLSKLRQKKINGGFVSTQDVRGKKWYRVRFGSYTTMQEAEQMASQSGFGTAWVVRLR